jgi:hypothetical protein
MCYGKKDALLVIGCLFYFSSVLLLVSGVLLFLVVGVSVGVWHCGGTYGSPLNLGILHSIVLATLGWNGTTSTLL